MRGGFLRAGNRSQQVGIACVGAARRLFMKIAAHQQHLHVGGHAVGDGLGVGRAVAGEDQARCQGRQDVAQLGVVLGDQRIRRRDGRKRHAHPQRGHAQAQVFEVVVAEDDQRSFRRQTPLRQRLAETARGVQHLRIRELDPLAIGPAPGGKGAIRRRGGVLLQAVGQARRVSLQRLGGTQHGGAIGAVFHGGVQAAATGGHSVAGSG